MRANITKFRRLEADAYEATCGGFDFHIRKEGDVWLVDCFNSHLNDPKAAYCASDTFDGFQDAIDFVLTTDCERAPR